MMKFEFTDEQKMIQEMASDFARRELAPVAARLDETKDRSILKANLKKMAELGLMSMNIPEGYGGAEVGVVAYSLAMTEVARACAATAVTMSVTNMVAEVILEFGTEEQKEKYIPKIASGEYPAAAFGLTEPQAGSDPGNMMTQAVADGDDFILNGSKIFITSAEYSGVFVIWAVTNKELPKGRGLRPSWWKTAPRDSLWARMKRKWGSGVLPLTSCCSRTAGFPRNRCWDEWMTVFILP